MQQRPSVSRDFRVDCQSQRYEDYQMYAGAMIAVYPVGIPLHYATLLWSNRVALQSVFLSLCQHLKRPDGIYTGR